jgi:S-adenosylmethionine hydrolase
MKRPLIALMTDFGTKDYFVASLKGVILSINPEAGIVDITHELPAFDVAAGGFVLSACAPFFPAGTIFVAVVDPGVGSARPVLVVRTGRFHFVAPDNGLLAPVLEREGAVEVRELADPRYGLGAVGRTFEGRDRMAPAAAWLSLGVPAAELGPRRDGYRTLPAPPPVLTGRSAIRGRILYADRFGNLITNIPSSAADRLKGARRTAELRLRVAGRSLRRRDAYASAAPGEVFFIDGSLGLVEIAAREASAAGRLGLKAGAPVRITAGP